MAITRSQQAKQMLQDGGMLVKPGFGGTRQGYRSAEAQEAQGRTGPGPSSTGTGGFGPTGPQELGISTRGPAGPVDKSTDEQNRLERIRTIEKLIDRPTFGLTGAGKFNVTDLFSGPRAAFKNPKRGDEGGRDMPLWMQLGYSSEEEYNRAMSGDTGAPVTSTPPVDLNRMAYRLMADGGAVMDDEPRQAYGLGSIVKKATRAIKKVAKSDIGKAAIAAAGIYYLGGGGNPFTAAGRGGFSFGNLPGAGFFTGASKAKAAAGVGGTGFFRGPAELGLTTRGAASKGIFGGLTGKAMLGIGAISALPLLGIGVEDEEEEKEPTSPYLGEGLDIAAIRADPRRFQGQAYRLMAEGGDTEDAKEPVAKKVMPLIDMDGKEKDYRETGGFVDMGRMEKADDVPARLSKNEFVFTADAVRNAGDGSVDKGAEVMYNMMKNLEAGGEVSEESQGLEGARKMFQTSQRLEEVL
jgi:hypothetical protein